MGYVVWHEPEQFSSELNNISLVRYTLTKWYQEPAYDKQWQKKNMVEDRIMDSGASFHATYCKEELERFKLLLLLDEEAYHVGFGDQEWKVTKAGVAIEPNIQSREHRASCRGSKDVMRRFSKYDLLNLPHTLRSDRVAYSRGGMVSGSDELRYNFQGTKSQQVIRSKYITFVDSIYGARGLKIVGASRIVKDQKKNTLKTEHPIRREAPRLHRYEDPPESPRLRWERRKPRVQVEEKFVRIKASTETMVDDMLVAGFDMAEFNKPKRWLPLVFEMKDRCSENKILRTKSLVEMFTGLVMKEKLKLYAASTGLQDN
ncbi:hypothetical protein Tco_1492061 [Tanacetum coccineum]